MEVFAKPETDEAAARGNGWLEIPELFAHCASARPRVGDWHGERRQTLACRLPFTYREVGSLGLHNKRAPLSRPFVIKSRCAQYLAMLGPSAIVQADQPHVNSLSNPVAPPKPPMRVVSSIVRSSRKM